MFIQKGDDKLIYGIRCNVGVENNEKRFEEFELWCLELSVIL